MTKTDSKIPQKISPNSEPIKKPISKRPKLTLEEELSKLPPIELTYQHNCSLLQHIGQINPILTFFNNFYLYLSDSIQNINIEQIKPLLDSHGPNLNQTLFPPLIFSPLSNQLYYQSKNNNNLGKYLQIQPSECIQTPYSLFYCHGLFLSLRMLTLCSNFGLFFSPIFHIFARNFPTLYPSFHSPDRSNVELSINPQYDSYLSISLPPQLVIDIIMYYFSRMTIFQQDLPSLLSFSLTSLSGPLAHACNNINSNGINIIFGNLLNKMKQKLIKNIKYIFILLSICINILQTWIQNGFKMNKIYFSLLELNKYINLGLQDDQNSKHSLLVPTIPSNQYIMSLFPVYKPDAGINPLHSTQLDEYNHNTMRLEYLIKPFLRLFLDSNLVSFLISNLEQNCVQILEQNDNLMNQHHLLPQLLKRLDNIKQDKVNSFD